MRVPTMIAAMTVLLGANAAAASLSSIQLEPALGARQVTIVHTPNSEATVTGACGPAAVVVAGAEVIDTFFGLDRQTTRITLRTPSSQRVIDPDTEERRNLILDDYVGVGCVRRGPRAFLLIWTNCGGDTCPSTWSFWVIDAATLKTLAPTKEGEICGARCAERLTGSALPRRLDAAG